MPGLLTDGGNSGRRFQLANTSVRRNVNLETAATTIQSTRDLDDAAHPRSGLFDDREPQTRTSGISVPPAVKTIKDSGTVTFRDARAIIRHSQHQDVGIRPQEGELHDNPAIVIAIADRVVDEVLQLGLRAAGVDRGGSQARAMGICRRESRQAIAHRHPPGRSCRAALRGRG